MKISIIVTDASPLITLAVADALDVLLTPGLMVVVPDMVRFEVTRHADKPGSQKLLEWIRDNEGGLVSVRSTEVFEEYEKLLSIDATTKSKSRGEQAASEILERELGRGLEAAILLFEDGDIKKTNFLIRLPSNVIVLSTSSFLDGLERSCLIDSADSILSVAIQNARPSKILERSALPMDGMVGMEETWNHSMVAPN